MRTNKAGFEVETCSRCGGTGQYSYNQIDGTVCFKCRGNKVTLTKRGVQARGAFMASLERPIESIQVGEQVFEGWPTTKWRKVEAVGRGEQRGASMKDGVMVPYRFETVELKMTYAKQPYIYAAKAGTAVKCIRNEAERQWKLSAALLFQTYLTKTGTVRKSV